ncbi:hypothetical protein F4821DRAFT_214874 [Hypoxylon rubiginosum]|uniref:Uncharacterized protein n=1 Tax=Hypoxylon rubiginosum TaxID=110542 RepID=A0ACC0CPY8_9PEZI|nr:hypothetical protein F4821DRAFT_214874 [Hypoxylon rubiginosum]
MIRDGSAFNMAVSLLAEKIGMTLPFHPLSTPFGGGPGRSAGVATGAFNRRSSMGCYDCDPHHMRRKEINDLCPDPRARRLPHTDVFPSVCAPFFGMGSPIASIKTRAVLDGFAGAQGSSCPGSPETNTPPFFSHCFGLILPALPEWSVTMYDINKLLLKRCETASEDYKQKSSDANHLIYCHHCLKSTSLIRNEKHDWCALVVTCPTCLPACFLAMGTDVSEAKHNSVFDVYLAPGCRRRLVYSDPIIRSLEGVVQRFFRSVQGLSIVPSSLNEPLLALTGSLPTSASDSIWRQPAQGDGPRLPKDLFLKNWAYIGDRLAVEDSDCIDVWDWRSGWPERKRVAEGYLKPAKERPF